MMQEPLISIIVPIYKVEDYLHQCIDSLIGQTYKNLEIILVDDGSPDNCPQICDDYAKYTNNIKVIHKPNGGLISARKAGVNISSGRYIGYVDGDDWVLKKHFANVAEVIERDNPDIIVHGYAVSGKKLEKKPPQNYHYECYNLKKIEETIIPSMFSVSPFYTPGIVPSVWGKIFRRELILPLQNSVPDTITIGEDAAVSYPAILRSRSIEFIEDCGYIYRTNESSMTHSYDRNLTEGLSVLIKYLSESMRIENRHNPLYKGFMDYICFMTLGTISNEICGSNNVRYALNQLQAVIEDSTIRNAVNRKETPVKVKVAYQIVKNKQAFLASCLKLVWSR